ncbi:MAG TPA: hypothetical protein VFN30_06695 [Chitinophagaceae bacterium]|nr:hypothetical protein [Chitinophagaceae bacterium]
MSFKFAQAQILKEEIYAAATTKSEREKFKQYFYQKTITETFRLPVTANTEYEFESALWNVTQFLYTSPLVYQGIYNLFSNYDRLSNTVRQALLEATYAVYPTQFQSAIKKLALKEKDPRLFAMEILYLQRSNPTQNKYLQNLLKKRFKDYYKNDLLVETRNWLQKKLMPGNKLPSLIALFRHQQKHGYKIIYSFQRWNRDYPGLAIVQNADGSFAKNEKGDLRTFQQLARSATNLPYFITNGNTPQGIYSIQGIGKSKNTFIGPTPNFQLVMPNETSELIFFHQKSDTTTYLTDYKKLLPPSWQLYSPIYETFAAGKIGRTEIIAHGTTVDPVFFKGKNFYPISPTLGCLCAREIWNEETGKLKESEMFDLINVFSSTPDTNGFLIVINLDNQQKPVTQAEIKALVKKFENNKPFKQ